MILDKKFEIKSMEELYLEDEVEKQNANSYDETDNIDNLVNSLSPINDNKYNFNQELDPEDCRFNKEENLELIESISDSLPIADDYVGEEIYENNLPNSEVLYSIE